MDHPQPDDPFRAQPVDPPPVKGDRSVGQLAVLQVIARSGQIQRRCDRGAIFEVVQGDSRRIVGDYVFTRQDLSEGKTFDDDICLITLTWPDVPVTEDEGWIMHPADGTQGDESYRRQTQDISYLQTVFGVPYRCLLPKGIDRLLVAGQTISMTYMAHEPGPCRGMVPCMHWGQAAGTAAALAVRQGVSPRRVDIPALRKALESQGVNLRKDAIDLTEEEEY